MMPQRRYVPFLGGSTCRATNKRTPTKFLLAKLQHVSSQTFLSITIHLLSNYQKRCSVCFLPSPNHRLTISLLTDSIKHHVCPSIRRYCQVGKRRKNSHLELAFLARHFSRLPACAIAYHDFDRLASQQGLLPLVGRYPRGQEQHAQQCCVQGYWQEQP
jgi:hypothetical protein